LKYAPRECLRGQHECRQFYFDTNTDAHARFHNQLTAESGDALAYAPGYDSWLTRTLAARYTIVFNHQTPAVAITLDRDVH
jgi:hypothetical protein